MEPGNAIYRCDGSRFATEVAITPYDFRNPAVLSAADSRRLDALHQKFAEHLSARLSRFLRLECGVTLTKFECLSFSKFIEATAPMTQVTTFQAEPLLGVGILDLNLQLCLAMTDRILGGKGRATEGERSLSDIELALLDDVIQLTLNEWCQQWPAEAKLNARTVGHDNSGRFLKTSLPNAILLTALLEVSLGELRGQLRLGVPHSMVAPILKQMQRESAPGYEPRNAKPKWRGTYGAIGVPVIAEWDVREIPVREVINLSLGDVLPMSADLIGQTRVQLAGVREFIGSVGVQNGHVAVSLTRKFSLE